MFIKNYIKTFNNCLEQTNLYQDQIHQIKDLFLKIKSNNKKVIIIGNGGSAAIASHVSVDMNKNAGVRTLNFNESSLLTCFSNDFGYDLAFAKAIEMYGHHGDMLVAISSSGQSKNILNACESARTLQFESIVTLSGFQGTNPLRTLGDINLWIDSSAYNMVENTHQFWLLLTLDLLISEQGDNH